jgi:ubiquinone/menaquinone biosynthesis C-methylase UbiE
MVQNKEVVDYYDSIADRYDKDRFDNSYGRFIDYEERRVLDILIDRSPASQRLEMACGTGRLTGYATHALDASEEMMKHARERHPDVHFRCVSADDTGFEDGLFDVVYAFHLMMHLDITLIQAIIKEASRILKPGGRFIFDIPSKKRRQLLHHKQASWHGGTELTVEEVAEMAAPWLRISRSFGIMMLPVHKLPSGIRNPLKRMDYVLANGWLKQYSSYLIVELLKP